MKKKIFALFFSILMVLSLVACTVHDPSTDTDRNTDSHTEVSSVTESMGTNTDEGTDSSMSVSSSDVPSDTVTDISTDTVDTVSSTSSGSPSVAVGTSLYDSSVDHKVILTHYDPRNGYWKGSIVVLDLNRVDQDWKKLDWKKPENSSVVLWKWEYNYLEFCGVKYRELPTGEKYVLAVSSSGYVFVIDYETREVAYFLSNDRSVANTDMKSFYNAHSAEMLPNGDLIVACSGYAERGWNYQNGGLRYLKRTEHGYEMTDTLSLPFAHAAHWDPSENCLWSIGFEGIVAVNLDTENGKMTKNAAKSLKKNDFTGHDIAPAFGMDGFFYVSDHSTVYLFDSATKTLKNMADYSRSGVKGIAHFEDGTLVTSTWSNAVVIYVKRAADNANGYTVKRNWATLGENTATQVYKIHTFTSKYE
ncbi:MAG: hypothetical protein IIV79_02870 [Clostridia bacterium]|nr:hypothetical protein [Clostridia bacterium]